MFKLMTVLVCGLTLAAAPAVARQTPASPAPTAQEIDAVLDETFAAWNVPGAAVAVVKDGQIVTLRGLGVRTAGGTARVDADTVFYTASLTKGFTATAIGALVGENRLRPDAPVSTMLPVFGTGGATQMGALTLRDLLAHRTGFPRSDLLMFSGLSQDEILTRMQRLTPAAGIRERFTYQNQMYMALGRILAQADGGDWSASIENRLLKPLGMTSSNADGLGHVGRANAAVPHGLIDGAVRPLDFLPREPYGGGGVNSTARDMANWVRFQLGDGAWEGTQILPAPVMAAMQSPQTVVQPVFFTPDANFMLYGLGWFLSDYEGTKVVQHGGNGEGWTALVWFMPEHRLGVVVMTNMNNSLLPYAVAHNVAHAYGLSPRSDWTRHFQAMETQRDAAVTARKPRPNGQPLPAVWAGVWRNPVYGDLTIALRDGGGALTYGTGLTATLRAVSDDTALLTFDRTDLAAITDGATAAMSTASGGGSRLVLTLGGDRIGFERVQ